MPFTEPSYFEIEVLQQDIDNASAGNSTNSLAQAMIRLNANKQLPGQSGDANPQTGCAFYAQLNTVIIGLQVFLLQVGVCSAVYGADLSTALIVAGENAGVPANSPYTAKLTKTN